MKEWKLLDLVFVSFFRFTSEYFQVTVTFWPEALGGNKHYFIPVSVILILILPLYSSNKIIPDTSQKLKITSVDLRHNSTGHKGAGHKGADIREQGRNSAI